MLNIFDSLAELVLDRPPVNAIDGTLVEQLHDAIDQVTGAAVGALLVRGEGRMLSAGADIAMIRRLLAADDGPRRLRAFAASLQEVCARLERLPVPIVAAIHGAATGGGLELALACDIRVTATDAKIGLPEASIGLLPGAGGTQRLAAVAGTPRALDLIMTSRLIDGMEAAQLGIASHAHPPGALLAEARSLAAGLAQRPGAAMAAIKRSVRAAPEGFGIELEETERLARRPVTAELIAAFFADHDNSGSA